MGLKLGLESLLDFVDDLDLNRKIDYCDSLEKSLLEKAEKSQNKVFLGQRKTQRRIAESQNKAFLWGIRF